MESFFWDTLYLKTYVSSLGIETIRILTMNDLAFMLCFSVSIEPFYILCTLFADQTKGTISASEPWYTTVESIISRKSDQGYLELYDFRACNNLRFSSESICEIPAIG